MRILHSPECTLEPQRVAHAAEMFSVLSDPAIYEHEGEPPPSVERLADGYRRRESRVSPDGAEKWLNWVVRLPTGELTGYVQATVLPNGASYVGFEFASRYWRRGLGTASVSALLEELAASYGVHTFVAVLKTVNFRSMGLLSRLGFEAATAEQAAEFDSEADEVVLLKPATSLSVESVVDTGDQHADR
jgi:RimJ/RimL family protein N-acetyltransferase